MTVAQAVKSANSYLDAVEALAEKHFTYVEGAPYASPSIFEVLPAEAIKRFGTGGDDAFAVVMIGLTYLLYLKGMISKDDAIPLYEEVNQARQKLRKIILGKTK